MNLNELAKKITLKEGKKVSLSIAQVKEVMKITLTELASMRQEEAEKIIARYKGKAR